MTRWPLTRRSRSGPSHQIPSPDLRLARGACVRHAAAGRRQPVVRMPSANSKVSSRRRCGSEEVKPRSPSRPIWPRACVPASRALRPLHSKIRAATSSAWLATCSPGRGSRSRYAPCSSRSPLGSRCSLPSLCRGAAGMPPGKIPVRRTRPARPGTAVRATGRSARGDSAIFQRDAGSPPGGEGSACANASDCTRALVCVPATRTCTRVATCTDASACGWGGVCRGGALRAQHARRAVRHERSLRCWRDLRRRSLRTTRPTTQRHCGPLWARSPGWCSPAPICWGPRRPIQVCCTSTSTGTSWLETRATRAVGTTARDRTRSTSTGSVRPTPVGAGRSAHRRLRVPAPARPRRRHQRRPAIATSVFAFERYRAQ